MATTDVVIIGAGHNGLIAAALLAKAGHSVVVLERADVVGGMAVTREFAPGFRAPALTPALGPLAPHVVRRLKGLGFDKHGLQFMTPDPALVTLGGAGESITFHRDPVFTAESITRVAQADSGRWREFVDVMQRLSHVFRDLNTHAAPDIDEPSRGDLWRLLNTGRRARRLGKKNLSRLFRYVPMAVADLASEWFSTDLMRAAVASRAVFGHFAGPWSAGTGAMLLQRLADDPLPVGSGMTVAGGPGALTQALAATAAAAGADVRVNAGVARVRIAHGAATGVILDNGDELAARIVLSAVDPKTTLQALVDPAELPPVFAGRVRNIRARPATAKINLALSTRPVFDVLHGDDLALRGRLLIAPGIDYLERAYDDAKYGRVPERPWLDISVPTVVDGSLADSAPAGQHVMSVVAHTMPAAPRDGAWDTQRDLLYRRVIDAIAPHAPLLERSIIAAEVITPDRIGHIYHGEQTLDQWWAMRPLLGWADGSTPIARLFLTGAGTHGGGGVTGVPGTHAATRVSAELRKIRRE